MKSRSFARSIFLAVTLLLLTTIVVSAAYWPVVKKGNTGRNVVSIQYLLRSRGYSVSVNGSFDTTTENAVKSFQTAKGLTPDGIVGENTWTKLIVTVQYGSSGDAVRAVQDQLANRYGCSVSVDGAFGSGTKSAVIAYQNANGLGADGVVGPTTWQYLVSGYDGLSESSVRTQLTNAGIVISSSGSCSNRCNTSCTGLRSLRQSAITGLINFKNASGCAITMTGGTETGHAAGTYSHWNGYKVDIGMSSCISNYIYNHYTPIGGSKYKDAAGNIYYYEGNHWDITYY